MMIKFLDTCSLLIAGERLFESEESFVISSVTLNELENIKTSANKDADIKYSARLILRLLEQHLDKVKICIHNPLNEIALQNKFEISNDTKILSDAIAWNLKEPITFVTNDLSLKQIAKTFLPFVESIEEDLDDYCGCREILANDEKLAEFYQNTSANVYNLHIGEYLIIRNEAGEVVDIRCWTGTEHRYLKYKDFNSDWFGKVSPIADDPYQKCLFDSLTSNQITLARGPAGSGKSYISLAYLFSLLDKHKIDKIIIFCNPVATVNSAKLGFYPGSRDEKLLDSQIGNMLGSKLGAHEAIEQLIAQEKLLLLPMSDIRGFCTSGMNAGIYITEAQNLDRTLIKLALQRIGQDCVCVIEGDDRSQVDLLAYAGNNNGMRRMSKVFRGQDFYGEITLKKIHRSKIAEIAEVI